MFGQLSAELSFVSMTCTESQWRIRSSAFSLYLLGRLFSFLFFIIKKMFVNIDFLI